MPWESVGDVNTGDSMGDSAWIEFAQDLAIQYVKFVCGDPPAGSELGIMWHDHELGSYPTIGVYSEFSPDFDYIHKCEEALEKFDDAISWSELLDYYHEQLDADGEQTEPDHDDEEVETDDSGL